MKCFTTLRRVWRPSKWLVTGTLILTCVSALLAADLKRVSPEEALNAVATRTKPQYNALAKQLQLSGSVGLDVVIAEDGTVETVTVVRGNPILASMATTAVKQWKFIPFKADGKAIRVIGEIVVQFTYSA